MRCFPSGMCFTLRGRQRRAEKHREREKWSRWRWRCLRCWRWRQLLHLDPTSIASYRSVPPQTPAQHACPSQRDKNTLMHHSGKQTNKCCHSNCSDSEISAGRKPRVMEEAPCVAFFMAAEPKLQSDYRSVWPAPHWSTAQVIYAKTQKLLQVPKSPFRLVFRRYFQAADWFCGLFTIGHKENIVNNLRKGWFTTWRSLKIIPYKSYLCCLFWLGFFTQLPQSSLCIQMNSHNVWGNIQLGLYC